MVDENISSEHLENDINEFEQKAKRRAREKGSFLMHFVTFLIVNFFLIIINLLTDKDNLWIKWVLIGWGIGLLIHFLSAYVLDGIVARYVDSQTEKEMRKMGK